MDDAKFCNGSEEITDSPSTPIVSINGIHDDEDDDEEEAAEGEETKTVYKARVTTSSKTVASVPTSNGAKAREVRVTLNLSDGQI